MSEEINQSVPMSAIPPVQPLQPPAQSVQPRRKFAISTIIIFILLALIVLLGVIFAADATVVRTIQLNAQATRVVHDIQNGLPARVLEQTYQSIISTPPTYTDPLASANDVWQTGAENDSSCTFTSQGVYDLHVGTQQSYITCLDIGDQYTNFLYQIHVKFLGNTWAGIVFRAADQNINYLFSIAPNGLYSLGVFPTETSSAVLAYGRSAAIHTGFNQDNTLAVIARDTGIALFINGQFVDSVQDGTLTQGAIGVYAGSLIGKPADVIFSDVKVWTLS